MTDSKRTNHYFSGGIYRVLSGLFGLFLTGLGIYVIFLVLLMHFCVWESALSLLCWGQKHYGALYSLSSHGWPNSGRFFNAFLI